MTAKYPASIATTADLGQPNASDMLDSPDHASLHRQITDEIIAIETALGVGLANAGGVTGFANLAAFPATGVVNKVYLALDTGKLYRWDAGLASYAAIGTDVDIYDRYARLTAPGDPSKLYMLTNTKEFYFWDTASNTYQRFFPTSLDGLTEGYANLAGFPAAGQPSSLYLAKDTGKLYRWDFSTNAYVAIGGGTVAGALHYDGAKDVTAALGTYAPTQGATVTASAAGAVNASWPGAAGQTVSIGDVLMFDGTNWHVQAGIADVNLMVRKTDVLAGAGLHDLTAALTGITPVANMVVQASKAGTPHASWAGITGTVKAGAVYQYNGTAWVVVDQTKVPTAGASNLMYVNVAGDTMYGPLIVKEKILIEPQASNLAQTHALAIYADRTNAAEQSFYCADVMAGSEHFTIGKNGHVGCGAAPGVYSIDIVSDNGYVLRTKAKNTANVARSSVYRSDDKGLELYVYGVTVLTNAIPRLESPGTPFITNTIADKPLCFESPEGLKFFLDAGGTASHVYMSRTGNLTASGLIVGTVGGVSQRMIGLQELKTIVAAAADFNAFKTAISALV